MKQNYKSFEEYWTALVTETIAADKTQNPIEVELWLDSMKPMVENTWRVAYDSGVRSGVGLTIPAPSRLGRHKRY